MMDVAPTPRRRGRPSRLFAAFGLFVCLLAVAGTIYNSLATFADRAQFPPAGTLVRIDGVRLHLQCVGSGSPTVVFESGLGVPALGWSLVTPGVSRFTRVCVYDRAGYGYSDPPRAYPRTSAAEADELHALLGKADIAAPYVLVGHSLGGHNARVFAGKYPLEVSGMVLVDAAHEEMAARLPRAVGESLRTQSRLFRLGAWASRVGLLRLWPSLSGLDAQSPSLRKVPPETLRALLFLTLQPKALNAAAAESESIEESGAQARAAGALGSRPLAVLASGRVAGLPRAEADEYRRIWIGELQPELSRLSTQGRLIILDRSGHMIPLEEPEALVEAVHEVVIKVRGAASSDGRSPLPAVGVDASLIPRRP